MGARADRPRPLPAPGAPPVAPVHLPSAAAAGDAAPRFPTIDATALSGRKYTLPRDLDGEVNLVLAAFARQRQTVVDAWLPAARALAAERPTLRYYELPTIRRGFVLISPIITSGMRGGVTDPEARAATITLCTNVDAFRRFPLARGAAACDLSAHRVATSNGSPPPETSACPSRS